MSIRVSINQYDSPVPASSIMVTGIAAQPGGQSGATPLTAQRNVVTSGGAGTGVKLQVLPPGYQKVFVRLTADATGTPQPVYPAENTKIEGYAINVPVTVADGGNATFTWDGVNTWLIS